jgi:hypothetical protein
MGTPGDFAALLALLSENLDGGPWWTPRCPSRTLR